MFHFNKKNVFFIILFCTSCSQNITGPGTVLGLDCDFLDLFEPIFYSDLTEGTPAALTRSPEYTWEHAVDACGVENYEVSIGTTIGGADLMDWTEVGNETTYRAENLALLDGVTYYMSVRAKDGYGNLSNEIHSPGWTKLDPISDLPNNILRLNGLDLASLIDDSGANASQVTFNNSIDGWLDTSGSANVHNWFSVAASNRPTYLPTENALSFNGISHFLTVNNHTDLNIGNVNQRNFTVVFETSSDISSRQVVYEEGANVRGMNVYMDSGNLYCGFWNTNEDGDGAQGFVSVSAPININSKYIVTWVFDYLNYTGPTGPDASLTCYLNGTAIGTATSTSLLYAHSGQLGLGAKYNATYYHDGGSSGNGEYFTGKVYELMIIESVPSVSELTVIYEYLSDKWTVP